MRRIDQPAQKRRRRHGDERKRRDTGRHPGRTRALPQPSREWRNRQAREKREAGISDERVIPDLAAGNAERDEHQYAKDHHETGIPAEHRRPEEQEHQACSDQRHARPEPADHGGEREPPMQASIGSRSSRGCEQLTQPVRFPPAAVKPEVVGHQEAEQRQRGEQGGHDPSSKGLEGSVRPGSCARRRQQWDQPERPLHQRRECRQNPGDGDRRPTAPAQQKWHGSRVGEQDQQRIEPRRTAMTKEGFGRCEDEKGCQGRPLAQQLPADHGQAGECRK